MPSAISTSRSTSHGHAPRVRSCVAMGHHVRRALNGSFSTTIQKARSCRVATPTVTLCRRCQTVSAVPSARLPRLWTPWVRLQLAKKNNKHWVEHQMGEDVLHKGHDATIESSHRRITLRRGVHMPPYMGSQPSSPLGESMSVSDGASEFGLNSVGLGIAESPSSAPPGHVPIQRRHKAQHTSSSLSASG